VSGSGTIRVMKRDRGVEVFDTRKLAAALWRSCRGTQATYEHAWRIAEAIELHVRRSRVLCVPSYAIFEMAVTALRQVGLAPAAHAAGAYRARRGQLRRTLRVRHGSDRVTLWDKAWLAELIERSWRVSRATGRTVAAKVEGMLLRDGAGEVSRGRLVEMLNRLMSEYGLADAVPSVNG